jgi:hypothetical protein
VTEPSLRDPRRRECERIPRAATAAVALTDREALAAVAAGPGSSSGNWRASPRAPRHRFAMSRLTRSRSQAGSQTDIVGPAPASASPEAAISTYVAAPHDVLDATLPLVQRTRRWPRIALPTTTMVSYLMIRLNPTRDRGRSRQPATANIWSRREDCLGCWRRR